MVVRQLNRLSERFCKVGASQLAQRSRVEWLALVVETDQAAVEGGAPKRKLYPLDCLTLVGTEGPTILNALSERRDPAPWCR